MADYTPGPWEVRPDMSVEDTETGTTIAAFCEEANARLIAAAPDLLAVLEAVQDGMGSWSACPVCSAGHGDTHADYCEYRLVIAAIAKARGE